MVMLDMEMLMAVRNERNFKTQSHRLYNELNYSSLKDAEQDLLHYFCNNKLKKMTLNEFRKIWNNTNEYDGEHKNRKYLLYQLTYSRQDILRKRQKEKDQKHETIESLKFNYVPTYTVDEQEPKEEKSPLERQKDLVLANLWLLFPRAKAQKAYIEATLNGKDFKFARTVNESIMLKQISDYSNKHRKDFDKVLNRELSNKDKKLLSFINTFLAIEDAENVTLFQKQGKQAEIVSQHKSLFEDLIGLCGEGKSHYITHQVALLNHWENIEYQEEKGYMIDYLRIKKEQLEKKLN
ncbi:hypothetical protein [Ligilactobacillus aviarius]|uniref:Uncharacterized protein n=1 Tax=Ligilactobacillus aviarius TaxID=1606 RepID=A0A179CDP5_9LACO|nr:hypothetical protein [Ligilactobacillus aviarius]OAP99171.1 hypothetical protein A3O09_06420 [Ligilactobacillus aviarius]OAP99725.1 hypothetical protein A3O08_04675 [Ligilactobacillus aviarius]OAQ00155.1 hypothetical protein A3O07_00090 [Ligilactobacillus aviarius]OAQ03525.1 hypothetical protein A3O13_06370 [Ligilactobacillus aviarius]OAQ09056.1 hypothetical protein A3O14_01845 [Ligilactobacillus aviarius]